MKHLLTKCPKNAHLEALFSQKYRWDL